MKNIVYIIALLFSFLAQSQEETTTIYLIRHAEKADASADPDLSEAGKARAARWAAWFKDKDITLYYTTPYKRTSQTMLAIAMAIDLVPGTTLTKEYRTYSPTELSLKEVANHNTGKNILIIGHSNTIPASINKLFGKETYKDIPEDEFDNLYIITITGDKITHKLVKM